MTNTPPLRHRNDHIHFQAVWTRENQHLAESCLETITRYAFFIFNKIAAYSILPALFTHRVTVAQIQNEFEQGWEENRLLNQNFTVTPLWATTPDGTEIRGTYFKHVAARENAPTVVLFQPNALLSKEGCYNWLLEEAALQEIPYNFVWFDYRGLERMSNMMFGSVPGSAKDLALDGETIYQLVRDELHVPPKDIHFYGYSLGGGVSAQVKKMHPETGRYVVQQSFTSINDVLKNVPPGFLPSCLVPLYTRIAGALLSLLNWNIDSTQAFENLREKTLIIHHPQDNLMKEEASLYRHLFQRAQPSPLLSHLDLSRYDVRQGLRFHGLPLEYFESDDETATGAVTRFLFATDVPREQKLIQIYRNSPQAFRNRVHGIVARRFQNGGHYLGSGEDACERRNGQSISNDKLARAVVLARRVA